MLDLANAKKRFEEELLKMHFLVDIDNWANPYYAAFRGIVDAFHDQRANMANHGILPIDEKVDFVFDERSEKKFIISSWDDYLSRRDDAVRQHYGSTPRFEKDGDFLPLQAADLWAWWVREWYEEENTEGVPQRMRDFDFGKWKGKRGKRWIIAMSYTENNLVDTFRNILRESSLD
jgi:hypothetical protein